MWTSFTKKAIGKSEENLFPETVPNSSNNQEQITQIKEINALIKSNKKSETTKKSNENNWGELDTSIKTDDIQEEAIINIDVDFIVKQIQDVLKSPSPLTLYNKSSELKENFAQFINYLAKKIAKWFNSESKTIIISMYQNAHYEQVWLTNLKNYLDEAKYFDVRTYLKAISLFDKEKQYIWKWLLKLYLGVNDTEIEKFLKKYNSTNKLSQIKTFYKLLWIDNIVIKDTRYLDENRLELFLEQLYFNSNDLWIFFQIFCFNADEMKWKFKDTYEIFSDIARSCLKNISPKTKIIYEYLLNDENKPIIKNIDRLIENYIKDKRWIYRDVSSLLTDKNSIERWYFWSYFKTKMIDTYFQEVWRLFYWDKNACSNRNEWSSLRWNFTYNPKSTYVNEINEILQFKKLILELNTNIFASFLKPLVYSIVSEKLSITRKDLLKIRYLMTLVLSENYQEYKKIYNFFEDLEAFMDYNMIWLWINFWKIKIFASDIILWIVWLVWLYIYAPVWVFVSCIILSISYIRSNFLKFSPWIEWNLWTRPIATVMLVISTFYWITNLDSTKIDISKLSSKVEKIWIYKTDYATKVAIKKINESKIKEAVANILQYKNNK